MVKRLRLSPLTAATRVRIPAESPKCASARCAFFHAGIQTRVRVLLCNPHPVHAVVFRARFAARHDSRLGQYFCALSRLMSLAYRQVSFVPFGAKFSQNSLPDTSWSRLNRIAFLSDRSMRISVTPSPVGVVCEADPGRVPRGGGKVVTRCFFRLSQVASRQKSLLCGSVMSQTKAVLDKSSKTAFLRFGFSAICRDLRRHSNSNAPV